MPILLLGGAVFLNMLRMYVAQQMFSAGVTHIGGAIRAAKEGDSVRAVQHATTVLGVIAVGVTATVAINALLDEGGNTPKLD